MDIIYLDKPSYLPDMAIQRLRTAGALTIYDDFPDEHEAIRRLNNADVAIVEWTELSSEVIQQLYRVKCIVLVTTAFDFVDINAAKGRGIVVCNTPEYSRQSVAEYIFAATLELSKQLGAADRLVRTNPDDAKYTDHTLGFELYRKTLGIWGLGSIGSWVAHIGKGFGMNVLGTSRNVKAVEDCTQVSFDELLKQSDVLAVTASVNPTTIQALGRQQLAMMKPGAVIVSVTDNQVLDEIALAEALVNRRIAAAALDGKVSSNSPLLESPNTLLTPGIAWYTQDSLDRNVEMFVDTVIAFQRGEPRFIVS